ncbi:MAG: hypothetical protein HQM16_07525 [Deltaproteobacteria bacterium]|nr:hypothetical protein [Deltaproteobacteria bacterium]
MDISSGFLVIATLLFVFVMAFFPFQSEDLFMYLAIAREFFSTGSFPRTDPFLFSIPNYEWQIMHEWASYLFFYGLYKTGGLFLVTGTKALIICLSMALPLFWKNHHPLKLFVWSASVMVVAFAASFRFVERANLFSDLFATLVFAICLAETIKPSKTKYGLPIIFLVWVQLHPGHLLGLFICIIFCLTHISARSLKEYQKFVALTLLSGVVCLVNPDGLHGMLYPITFALNEGKVMQEYYYEWFPSYQGVFLDKIEIHLMLGLVIVYAIFFMGGLVLKYKSWTQDSPGILGNKQGALFAVVVLSLITFMALKGIRFIPTLGYFLITAGCFVVPERRNSSRQGKINLLLIVVVICFILKIMTVGYASMGVKRTFGYGIDPVAQPTKNLEIIEQANFNANMYNSHRFGSYLAWQWQKKRKIFYHGFVTDMNFYTRDYFGISRSKKDFDQLVGKYHLKGFIIERLHTARPLLEIISTHPDWQFVSEDPASLLFIKKDVIRHD